MQCIASNFWLIACGYVVDIVLMADATAALGAAQNLNGSRMRHVKLADTFVKKCIRDKIVKTQKIGTKDQKGDLYTKHVDKDTMLRLSTRYQDCSSVAVKKVPFQKLNAIGDLKDATSLVQTHKEVRRQRTVAEWLRLYGAATAAMTLAAQFGEAEASQEADHPFGGVAWLVAIVSFVIGVTMTMAVIKFKSWIESLIEAASASQGTVNEYVQTESSEAEVVCRPIAGSRPVSVYISPGGTKYHTRGDCQAMLGMTNRMVDIQSRTFCGHCAKRENGPID